MQQAAADVRARQAAIQSARAGVKQAEVDLDRTVIRSPIDGIVVNRNVDVGQTIAATLQSPVLFTIADLRSMHLLTEVNEGEVGGCQPRLDGLVPDRVAGPADVPWHRGGRSAPALCRTGRCRGNRRNCRSGRPDGRFDEGKQWHSGSVGKYQLPDRIEHRSRRVYRIGQRQRREQQRHGQQYRHDVQRVVRLRIVGRLRPRPRELSPTRLSSTCRTPTDVLAPGATAIVTLGGGSRQDVVRVPNNALSFRPPPAMLERTGQADLTVRSDAGEVASSDRNAHVSQVWRFENNQFVPLDVLTGLSDDRWTEVISGPVKAWRPARDERRRQIALRPACSPRAFRELRGNRRIAAQLADALEQRLDGDRPSGERQIRAIEQLVERVQRGILLRARGMVERFGERRLAASPAATEGLDAAFRARECLLRAGAVTGRRQRGAETDQRSRVFRKERERAAERAPAAAAASPVRRLAKPAPSCAFMANSGA